MDHINKRSLLILVTITTLLLGAVFASAADNSFKTTEVEKKYAKEDVYTVKEADNDDVQKSEVKEIERETLPKVASVNLITKKKFEKKDLIYENDLEPQIKLPTKEPTEEIKVHEDVSEEILVNDVKTVNCHTAETEVVSKKTFDCKEGIEELDEKETPLYTSVGMGRRHAFIESTFEVDPDAKKTVLELIHAAEDPRSQFVSAYYKDEETQFKWKGICHNMKAGKSSTSSQCDISDIVKGKTAVDIRLEGYAEEGTSIWSVNKLAILQEDKDIDTLPPDVIVLDAYDTWALKKKLYYEFIDILPPDVVEHIISQILTFNIKDLTPEQIHHIKKKYYYKYLASITPPVTPPPVTPPSDPEGPAPTGSPGLLSPGGVVDLATTQTSGADTPAPATVTDTSLGTPQQTGTGETEGQEAAVETTSEPTLENSPISGAATGQGLRDAGTKVGLGVLLLAIFGIAAYRRISKRKSIPLK